MFFGEKEDVSKLYPGPLAWCMEGLRGGADDMSDEEWAHDYGPNSWSAKKRPEVPTSAVTHKH